MGVRRFVQAVLLLSAVFPARSAHAQPERLNARLRLDRNLVRTQFAITNVFTEAFRKRLAGGLTSRAVLSVELLTPDGSPLVLRRRRCELRLDVWDEIVFVRIQDEKQDTFRRVYKLIDRALRACGTVDIPLVPLARLTEPAGYQVRVRVALNPISPELIERSRQFMSNPRGAASGRPQAFFGAVARLFRSESDAGGTVFVFKSDGLTRPSVEARTP